MRAETARVLIRIVLTAAAFAAAAALGGLRRTALRQGDGSLAPFRLGLSLVIGADTAEVLLLACRMLEGLRWSEGRALAADGLLAAVCVCAAVLLRLRPLSLFPEESAALPLADRTQRRRLHACLWRLLAGFAAYGCWLALLLYWTADGLPSGAAAAVFGLAAVTLALFFWSGRQSVKTAYERIETLVDKQYQAELVNFMQVIRAQRHDFNIHLQAVVGMIESGRYADCAAYVREMARNAERLNDVLPLDNPVIGAQVNAFREIAAGRHIRLDVQILNQLEGLPCTVYEANIVLGNLLQNAIDEVSGRDEDRWVTLLIMKRSRRHIIKVSNPCDKKPEDYEKIFNVGYSTKQSHEGIGLASVKKIVTKYGGTIYLEHEPGVVHFIAKIPEGSEARG